MAPANVAVNTAPCLSQGIRCLQEAAMASDVYETERAMAPITGAIFSALYLSIAVHILGSSEQVLSPSCGRGRHIGSTNATTR
jgi:hypothetical protein